MCSRTSRRLSPSRLVWLAGLLALAACSGEDAARSFAVLTPIDQEIQRYRAKLERDPGLYPVRAQLGGVYLERARANGDWEDLSRAEEALLTSLRQQETEEALRWLAAVRLDQHRFDEAAELARRALDAWPRDGIARAVLGDALLARGEVEAALRAYTMRRGQEPDFYSLSGHARCLFETGDVDGASAKLREALAGLARERPTLLIRKARAWCHLMLGSYLFETGEAQAALREYEAALRLHRSSVDIREHRAEWEVLHGDPREAARRYEEIVLDTPRPDVLVAFGELLLRLGREQEGHRHLERAQRILRRRLAAGDVSVRRALALLLLDHGGDASEALRLARADLETRRDALAYDTLAWALFRNGRTDQARDAMRKALRHGTRRRVLGKHRAAMEKARN